MKTQLVYAEIIDFITDEMREDPLVQIISDNAVFLVTTEENSKQYPLDFYPVSVEVMEAYDLLLYLVQTNRYETEISFSN